MRPWRCSRGTGDVGGGREGSSRVRHGGRCRRCGGFSLREPRGPGRRRKRKILRLPLRGDDTPCVLPYPDRTADRQEGELGSHARLFRRRAARAACRRRGEAASVARHVHAAPSERRAPRGASRHGEGQGPGPRPRPWGRRGAAGRAPQPRRNTRDSRGLRRSFPFEESSAAEGIGPCRSMILAGDIGGTNVRLALFEIESGRLVRKDEQKFRSREVPGLEGPVETFLAGRRVLAAGFGVAGPVHDGRCEATNLPWVVDAALLAGKLSLPRVALVNDLFANALGLSELSGEDFAVVNAGMPDLQGTAALISAGTGLGEAYLVRRGGRFEPQASEGGHASFAPRNPFEIDFLRHLHRTYSHVSFERVLSGPGLAALYAFERSRSAEDEPAWLSAEIAAAGDASPGVTAAPVAGEDPVAARALEHFISIYGGEAGNLRAQGLAV